MQDLVVDDSVVVSSDPLIGLPVGTPGATNKALVTYEMSFNIVSIGMTLGVVEVAVRIQSLIDGDRGWWKPERRHNRTVVDAAGWLQGQSNL